MSLFFRWFLTYFYARFRAPTSMNTESKTPLRVYPNDLDLLLHVNNGRYFTFQDIARLDWMLRSGHWKSFVDAGWYPVVVAETLRFKKSLRVFQSFDVTTRLLGWDERDFYLEHRFLRKGETYASGIMRARFLKKKGGQVPPAEVMKFAGYSPESEPLPEYVANWRKIDQR